MHKPGDLSVVGYHLGFLRVMKYGEKVVLSQCHNH